MTGSPPISFSLPCNCLIYRIKKTTVPTFGENDAAPFALFIIAHKAYSIKTSSLYSIR